MLVIRQCTETCSHARWRRRNIHMLHTWAKALYIFKEAKFLGKVCENCSNYLHQHTIHVFYYISAKVLLLWFIAHWENDDDPWQHVTYQKVSMPVACCRHLELSTTRLFFHIYCQYATKKVPTHQHVCKVANYWTSKVWLKTNGHCQPVWWWPKWWRQNFVQASPNPRLVVPKTGYA